MLSGIQLSLMMGPLPVPLPAPLPLVEALQSVQVTAGRDHSGFQLTFNLGKKSPLQLAMLPAGLLDPMATRVVITVIFRGLPQVIADGVVTHHQIAPSNEPGQSTLTLTGEDLSVLMDIVDVRIPYPAMPDIARINLILSKYAAFGLIPAVVPHPITSVKSPTSGYDVQTGTDRQYIKGLASRCGYVFLVEPGPVPLTSTAYFGPDLPLPVPQLALSVNMDWQTNVESLSFSLDGMAKKLIVATILDPATRKIPIPIPVPNISVLHPPLGARLGPPSKVQFTTELASLPTDEALKRIFGLMLNNADAISGNGSLNTTRYGQILRPRTVVGVRGAGLAYDGFYYVNSVTHQLKRGEYKQSFTLSRDGLVSLTPAVGP